MSIPIRPRQPVKFWRVAIVNPKLPPGFRPTKRTLFTEEGFARIGMVGDLVMAGSFPDVYWVRFPDGEEVAFNRKHIRTVRPGEGVLKTRPDASGPTTIVKAVVDYTQSTSGPVEIQTVLPVRFTDSKDALFTKEAKPGEGYA